MRTQTLAAFLFAVSFVTPLTGAEEPTHVFLLIGQSNMAGRAEIEESDKEGLEGTVIWNFAERRWEPAVPPFNLYSPHRKATKMQRLTCGPSFVREYRKAHSDCRIGIVCAARGGTSIEKWRKGQVEPWPLYDSAVSATKAALESCGGQLKGILWHQGESNAGRAYDYPESLATLVQNLRDDFALPQLPFVFAQIGDWRSSATAFNRMIVRQPETIHHTACVQTAGLTPFDNAHFDSVSQRELGRRYARAINRLAAAREPLEVADLGTFRKSRSLSRAVISGPFEFQADVSLARVEGTAASVWFGDQLNFGFDSRTGRLFVEGSAIGKTTFLASTEQFVRPRQVFRFRATRSESGRTAFFMGETEVFATEKLDKQSLLIRFRPRRNEMTVTNVSLSGANLAPPPRPIEIRTHAVPLLIGQANTVATIKLNISRPLNLIDADVKVDGLSDDTELRAMAIECEAGRLVLQASDNKATQPESTGLSLPAGLHELRLVAELAPAVSLRDTLAVAVGRLSLTDSSGESVTITPEVPHTPLAQRMAVAIHRRSEHDCHTTRIPAISRTPEGTLLAVYDLRYNSRRDLQEHIDIGLSRSTDNGQTWELPRPIMDMGEFGGKPQKENGCSDPNILVDRTTGEILVSAVWTHGKPGTHQWSGRGSEPGFGLDQTSQFMVVRSNDDGVTWSEPKNLTRALKKESWWLFAPAPGNGITLKDGTLVMPTQGRDENGHPFSNIMQSGDHGDSWTLSRPARDNTTECSVAELSDGSLMLNMRDNRNRADKSKSNGRAVAVTKDLGTTWAKHKTDHSALPEPVCMASLISHTTDDGQHLLVFSNPRSKKHRKQMTVQFSFDDGNSWPREHHVLLDEAGGAYSSLVIIDDTTVGVLYESSQADLVYQLVPIPTNTRRTSKGQELRKSTKANETTVLRKILFGSCIKEENPVPILETIGAQEPDLFIFLGDNIYADTEDMAIMRSKYAMLGDDAGFRKLRKSTRVLATWDDHDYGMNDAGVEYSKKVESQREFLDFWKEPKDSPLRSRPGIYASHVFGPVGKRVQIIMLDTRYFRSPLKRGERRVGGHWVPDGDPRKTMLGEAQWKWLEQELRRPAELRVVATSIQAIAEDAGQETWSNLPGERKKLFDLVAKTEANGVIFISGDRHWSELSCLRDGVPYPLFDLTSSSLNQVHGRGTPTKNRFRISPTTYHRANFGAIVVDWKDDPVIKLEIRDTNAKMCLEHTLSMTELRSK